ncbi:UDP-glucose 4-epimerase GalE [Cytobacillus firmus]|uniref:UDP-glucose 4-epimerase GalE n=1 Tax=Cytobacillus firmus TaxID=1399 RepID=UPI0024C1BD58|nr:UDP-glucose 4-epimerase GalE [Cytobacillus firmus]WHY61127.1 UDP-glucose 4-epimerase GalE [Cytobacillus firmus]
MTILVTGGAGYIGSHTCVELLKAGYDVAVVDNFVNSKPEALKRVQDITGKTFKIYNIDLLDEEKLETVFINNNIEAVIHFAGLKAVGESVHLPLRYFHNNITSTVTLCKVMQKYGVKNLVFSSSATVYGMTEKVPIIEDSPLFATNPYGRTKLMIEEILRDLYESDNSWRIALLRYFNPIGAHESGLIGEDPNGIPNNLMPYITQVAVGKLKELNVYGSSYPTRDGTGIRDYIHVVDLAMGHLKALEKVADATGIDAYNLGTGKGYSVLEMVRAFEEASGVNISYKITDPRPGDVAICYADPAKAHHELGWRAEKGIEEMCTDSWRWQFCNPNGFETKNNMELEENPRIITKSEDFSLESLVK